MSIRRDSLKIYQTRVNYFLNWLQNFGILSDSAPLSAKISVTDEPVPFADRLKGKYREAKLGEQWGREWQSAWLHVTGSVPREWKGRDVVLHLGLNGESCLFDSSGCPIYGMTNGSVFAKNYGKDMCRLYEPCKGGEKVDLWIEAAANNLFGVARDQNTTRNCPTRHGHMQAKLDYLSLRVLETEVWHLMLDLEVLYHLYSSLPENTPRRNRILEAASAAIDVFHENPANAKAAREVLRPALESRANASDVKVAAVGHAHIDTGWLWPVRETIRKCARTFSSQLDLMKRYPGYVFGASQPQLYDFVKKRYPALYAKIKVAVKEGRWEPQGGMWVEADCNVISGESMVRQILHGKNFYMDEFGFDVKNLFLPDVFGYSANLPQILRRSGIDYFITQKISWSDINEFPHNTFNWRGIDGEEVLVHFPPENSYNSNMLPSMLLPGQTRFKENGYVDEMLSLYGIGNGGGGPKEEHVERALRARNLEGCPKVKMGRLDDFLKRLERFRPQLPTWVGELYLELHRATLTTQARNKRYNRLLEHRLRNVEMLYSCLPLSAYPAAEMDYMWKKLLINQFHDIIPGSSIHMVYETSWKEYEECLATLDELTVKAQKRLFKPAKDALTLFNPLSCAYAGAVALPAEWKGAAALDAAGNEVPTQAEDGSVCATVRIPPQGFVTLRKGRGRAAAAPRGNGLVLENALVRYEFTREGRLCRAFDKEAEREVLAEGKEGNLFTLYYDRPNNYDAWDVDLHYEHSACEHARCTTAEFAHDGDVRQVLRFEFAVGNSTIRQEVTLEADAKRLDFKTKVKWYEMHRMLRVAFPTAIRAEQASFEIQYGYLKRNTHRNTSWDVAKFEVVGHRYVDLSDNCYGVALLNDCKYGHKVLDGVIDLNLLRAPRDPDPDADLGEHEFTYAFLPHLGALDESCVFDEAAKLNQRPLPFAGVAAAGVELPCALESDGISLEVLKKAEKENCLVARLVEKRGRDSAGTFRVGAGIARIVETDLMEWKDLKRHRGRELELALKPFELRTFKLYLK